MPHPAFFRQLGLFARDDFLDAAFCARLRSEMREAAPEEGRIIGNNSNSEGTIDESVRRVSSAHVSKGSNLVVTSRLKQIKLDLEHYFRVSVTSCDGPHYLIYEPGDFYKPHEDASPGAPIHILQRRVSLVVFLNAVSKDPAQESYGGGALTFHGLMRGPGWEKCAFSLDASPGLLVAFRPSVVHEVRPVTFGRRFTIAAWLVDESQSDFAGAQ